MDLLNEITKKNIRNMFVLIDVNKVAFDKLPNFVDRVPLIVTPNKEIVVDDSMHPFIDKLYEETGSSEIEPFSVLLSGPTSRNALSDQFSFIESPDSCVNDFQRGFVFIGNDSHIQIEPEQPQDTRGSSKFDNKALENLKAQRDMDIQRAMPPNGRRV